MENFGKIPTPGQKMAAIAKRLGNPAQANQQTTTRIIYDSLPLDGRTTFNFFDGVGARQFPFANLAQNRLEVGESLVIERMSLSILTVSGAGVVTGSDILDSVSPGLYRSDFSFIVGNQQVLKKLNLIALQPEFNKSGKFLQNENYAFMSQIVIPSLLDFVAVVRTTFATVTANTYLHLSIEGTGMLVAPKENF